MAEQYFCSGEILPRLLADKWAELNECEPGQDAALLFEIQIRRTIEAGIRAGKICKLSAPSLEPARPDTLFEDSVFAWSEIRGWEKEYRNQDWPAVPPWTDSASAPAPEATDKGAWMAKVKEIAVDVYLAKKNGDWTPTQDDVAKEVEKICRKRGLRTGNGKELKLDYIKRHALRPWSEIQETAEAKRQNG